MNGDFLGFSFDGIHSSRLGITRVSNGDRYNESLTPEIEDKIISVPGEDGSYFFGSLYRNKTITVSIAFDSLNESQFRQLRKLLSTKKPGQLIFDERPYKVYTAKIASPPQLNYICFDEPKKEHVIERDGVRVANRTTRTETYTDPETGETITVETTEIERERVFPYAPTNRKERIYKGEGTIEFLCIKPFATEQFKVLDLYGNFDFQPVWGSGQYYKNNPRTAGEAEARIAADGPGADPDDPKYTVIDINSGNTVTIYENVEEWAESSGILPYEFYKRYNVDTVFELDEGAAPGYNACLPVYNAGDIDAPFYLFLPYTNNGATAKGTLEADSGDWIDINVGNRLLRLNPFESEVPIEKENGVIINTNNHLIEGVVYDMATSTWRTTGNLYNEYIVAGDFPKILGNDWSMFDTYDASHTQAIFLNCATAIDAKIHYNYLYY